MPNVFHLTRISWLRLALALSIRVKGAAMDARNAGDAWAVNRNNVSHFSNLKFHAKGDRKNP
jgi:hypothetical protein